MLAVPEKNAPAWSEASATVEINKEERHYSRNPGPTSTEIAVADAVAHVRHAGRHLLEATFRLDEGGFHCDALHDLTSDVSALVAVWAGRIVPTLDISPPHVSEAAKQWRRENRSGY